jgi:hypothetical protein
VQARVRTPEPARRLDQVAGLTEQRCPVRILIADAGVTLEMTWATVLG